MIEIYFFASLREKLRCDATTLEWPGGTVQELIAALAAREGERWRQCLQDEQVLVAVNQKVVALDTRLNDGDEVAFFPPVTGG